MEGLHGFLPKLENIKKEEGPKVDWEFQQLGIEMTQHFGKKFSGSIWSNFHKADYTLEIIREAWFVYQKQAIKSFPYFMGILNKKAGITKSTKK